MIAHVVMVIDFAVQQFQANRDAAILGRFLDAIQSDNAVLFADIVGHALRLPEKVITLGTLAAAASSIFARISFSSLS